MEDYKVISKEQLFYSRHDNVLDLDDILYADSYDNIDEVISEAIDNKIRDEYSDCDLLKELVYDGYSEVLGDSQFNTLIAAVKEAYANDIFSDYEYNKEDFLRTIVLNAYKEEYSQDENLSVFVNEDKIPVELYDAIEDIISSYSSDELDLITVSPVDIIENAIENCEIDFNEIDTDDIEIYMIDDKITDFENSDYLYGLNNSNNISDIVYDIKDIIQGDIFYYSDMANFAYDHYEEVLDIAWGFGLNENEIIYAAEENMRDTLRDKVYDNKQDIIMSYAIDYYCKKFDEAYISEDLFDELKEENFDSLSEITDLIDEYEYKPPYKYNFDLETKTLTISANNSNAYINDNLNYKEVLRNLPEGQKSQFTTLYQIEKIVFDDSIKKICQVEFTNLPNLNNVTYNLNTIHKSFYDDYSHNYIFSHINCDCEMTIKNNQKEYKFPYYDERSHQSFYEQTNMIILLQDKGIKITPAIINNAYNFSHRYNEDLNVIADAYANHVKYFNTTNMSFTNGEDIEQKFFELKERNFNIEKYIIEKDIKDTVEILGVTKTNSEKEFLNSFENKRKELTEAFQDKFHFVPKIINSIAFSASILNIQTDDIIKNFDGKLVSKMLSQQVPECAIASLIVECDKNTINSLLGNDDINLIASLTNEKCYLQNCKSDENENINHITNAIDWIKNHSSSNYDIKKAVVDYAKYIEIEKNTTVETTRQKISDMKATNELKRIEEYYSKFHFDDCKCELKQATVEMDGYKAYIMDGKDPRQVLVGYDTHCCQHLGGAGETAMMYGLANPNAGFWVIENVKTGKILAQAESWENDKNTLVFDNIEFADNRHIDQFAPIIAKWCDTIPYENIYMGNGYNEMVNPNMEVIRGYIPPVSDTISAILNNKKVYSDSKNNCTVIKDGNKLANYFESKLQSAEKELNQENKICCSGR